MTQFITTTITGNTDLVDDTVDSNIFITQTGALLATTGTAIETSVSVELFIHGTVTGDSRGVRIGSNTTDNKIFVAETGTVTGGLSGIVFSAEATGEIVNYGTITGIGSGIDTVSGNVTLINYGAIIGFGAHGIEMTVQSKSVNYGSITGNEAIDIFRNDDETSLVEFDNFGTLTGTNGIAVNGDSSNPDQIFNAGIINGTVLLEAGDNILTNAETGVINGNYEVFGDDDTLINNGGIYGDVLLSFGNDTVTNGGLISGDVLLGQDDDVYTAIGTGVVSGVISGGSGNDTITGGALADFIDGGDDNDRLFGRGGDDDIRGGLGSDFMSAGAGDDFVLGDNGADRIFGGGGEDTLQGGRDLDTIRGGDGDDEINGGRSADILRGGSGADTFLYQFRQDSTLNLSDRIQDFEVGVDVIDVSATASQLSFIGSAAFSGSGNEVRYEIGGNGRTFVEVDTDANGSADMRILLGTVGALTEDDFVL